MLADNRTQFLGSSDARFDHNDSKKFAETHAVQFENLINTIRYEGFKVSSDLPRAFVLIDGVHWRWVMAGNGNHRAYSMALLGYRTLPITINGVIKRENYEKWSNVVGGDFTKPEALRIFDAIFEGSTLLRGCF